MKFQKPVIFLLFVSLFAGLIFRILPTFAANQEIDTLQQKIKEKQERVKQLEESIEEYKKKIAQKQVEAQSLNNQLSILDNRITEVQLDIEATENSLAALQYEIERDTLVISNKETDIEKQKKMIAEMIRTIHYNDDQTYLDIAANYENFSDFYNQVQYLKNVEGDLAASLTSLRISKEELNAQREQTLERKKAQNEVKLTLEEKRKDFKTQVYLKEDLLTQTKASELTYKTLLSTLKSQHQQIEGEITGIEREMRRKLEEENKLNKLDDDAGSTFSWPVPSKVVTARFHDPEYPYRNVFEHSGMDIRASYGTPIKAAASGYVAQAKHCTSSSCYAYVMIIHQNGLATLYGHMSSVNVKVDQFVARGDVIGASGGTPGTVGAGPFVTGAHLHFEVRKNGIPTDPGPYLSR